MTVKNTLKCAVVALLFLSLATIPQDEQSQKTINCGNIAKATFLSTASAVCALFYYATIIQHIIGLTRKKGLAFAIDYNKKFVLEHPPRALIFAIPLFASIGFALIARDYMKKIWEKQKNN